MKVVLAPRTQFASLGEDRIAYQVWGDGPLAVVLVYGFYSHVELNWEAPALARLFDRLGRSVRLVQFDRRGTGLSDRPGRPMSLEDRVDDVLAVIDAIGAARVALLGQAEGAATSIVAAAGHRQQVSHLVLYAPMVRMLGAADFPWGAVESRRDLEALADVTIEGWGDVHAARRWAPDATDAVQEALARYQRMAITPKGFRDMLMAAADIDIRSVLSTLRVPMLILHKTNDPVVDIGQARYLRDHVDGARLVELAGSSHLIADDDTYAMTKEIIGFLTGKPADEPHDRVLATVMYTDLVGSTRLASAHGDDRWLDVLDDHDDLVRRVVEQHRGRLIKRTGDGALATFDGPARAVRAAQEILTSVHEIGLEARAGVHTGEIELRRDDIGGLAVHIGARITALAQPNQVVVSRTVVDLVVGSQITFTDLGDHILRGVPGAWHLFAVRNSASGRSV